MPNNESFVPVLTVMPDFGNAPFLWLRNDPTEAGVGEQCAEGGGYDDYCPLSEGLWRKFADWAIEFDKTDLYLGAESKAAKSWDWDAYHASGIQLSKWLKEEVGVTHRVIYYKPFEDPNHHVNERQEVLADGTLQVLPSCKKSKAQ